MTNGSRTDRLSSAWIVLGCALAVSITFSVSDRIRLPFQPGYFLPLLAAWLASRGGTRVVAYMLLLGVMAALDISISMGPIKASLGFSSETYFVSVLAACAFAYPRIGGFSNEWLRPWWRWALWAMLCALAVAGFLRLSWRYEIEGAFKSTWEAGGIFAVLVALATVRWPELTARLRPALAPLLGRPIWAATVSVCVCMLAAALFVNIRFHAMDIVRVGFGLGSSWYWLTVACFAVTAFGLLDWRVLIAVLILLFAGDWACTTLGISLSGQPFVKAPRWSYLLSAVSAALLGRAIQPFWSHGDLGALHGRRTLWLLTSVLSIQFIILPLVSRGQSVSSEPLLLGGVTFMAGLLWGRKALFAAPLSIMLCFLIGIFAYDHHTLWWLSSEMGQFGLVAFPYVYFGVLVREGAEEPGSTEDTSRTVDVTPLAKIVRELDVSATLKAFVAVLAPLVVLSNLGKIIAFFANVMEMDFDFFDSGETLLVVAFFFTTILAVFAPLGFIVTDWLARRETGRYLSAISGAALGLLGIVVIAQGLGASTLLLEEIASDPFDAGRWILAGALSLVLALVLGRMLAHSERTRGALLGVLVLLGITILAEVVCLAILDLQAPEAIQRLLSLLSILAIAAVAIWFIVRGVRLRLLLSGSRPRSLLLGELRGGFWVRIAFLVGLPSSMWRLSAIKRPSFWLFVSSRPIVYIGAVLLVAKASRFGPFVKLGLGAVLIVAGHLAFVAAKRLASREVWRPESGADTRAPILFLRSFDDDQFDFKRPVWDVRGRWFDLWSFRANADEALIDEVAQYGPVVALGRPGETRAPFGALRHYATDDEWQAVIIDTARRAQAIVIVVGDSQGVLWEYDLLKREGLIDRTLLLFRPGTDDAAANRRALEAFSTVQGVKEDVKEGQHMVALLPAASGSVLLVARQHMAGAFMAAIRAHLQKCTVRALRFS